MTLQHFEAREIEQPLSEAWSSDHYPYFVVLRELMSSLADGPCEDRSWYTIIVKECSLCWRAQAQSVVSLGLSAVDVFLRTRFAHIDWDSWILLFGADLKSTGHVTFAKRWWDFTSGCESWLDLDCVERAFAMFWSLLLCYDKTKLNSNMGYDHATVNAGKFTFKIGVWMNHSHDFCVIIRRQSEKRHFGWDQ